MSIKDDYEVSIHPAWDKKPEPKPDFKEKDYSLEDVVGAIIEAASPNGITVESMSNILMTPEEKIFEVCDYLSEKDEIHFDGGLAWGIG